MARIDVKNGFGFNLALLDLNAIYEAQTYLSTSTVFRADYGGGTSDTFRGSGFTYNVLGEPTGGLVTSYQGMGFGQVVFTVTGISTSAAALAQAARSGSNSDDLALFRSELGGNDVLTRQLRIRQTRGLCGQRSASRRSRRGQSLRWRRRRSAHRGRRPGCDDGRARA